MRAGISGRVAERYLNELRARSVALRFAKTFPTEDALEAYLKAHPRAKREKHSVKPKQERGTPRRTTAPTSPGGAAEESKPAQTAAPKEDAPKSEAKKAEPEVKKPRKPRKKKDPPKTFDYAKGDETLKAHVAKVFGEALGDAEFKTMAGMSAKLPDEYEIETPTIRQDYWDERKVSLSTRVTYKGSRVGSINRSYYRDKSGELVVSHDSFFIQGDHQGSGVGKAVFNSQIDTYEKMGVGRVELTAAEVGKYVWSKAGFEWTNQQQVDGIKELFEDHLREMVGTKAARDILADIKTGGDISQVEVGGKRVGKDFLINLTEDDVKSAGDGSEYIEMAQAPAKIKRL